MRCLTRVRCSNAWARGSCRIARPWSQVHTVETRAFSTPLEAMDWPSSSNRSTQKRPER
jgi:hypothetical protein